MVADAEPQQAPPPNLVRLSPSRPPPTDGRRSSPAAASPKLLKAPAPARPFDLGAIARVLTNRGPCQSPPIRPLVQAAAASGRSFRRPRDADLALLPRSLAG